MKRNSQLKRSGFKPPVFGAKRPFKRVKLIKVGQRIKKPINLHRKAWDTFSRWVRKRDKGICITCGDKSANQAGHFWHGVLDFSEMNINLQCKTCNHFKSGNLAPYSVYLVNKYGLEAFKDLETKHLLALRGEFRTDQDYLNIIEKYKDK